MEEASLEFRLTKIHQINYLFHKLKIISNYKQKREKAW